MPIKHLLIVITIFSVDYILLCKSSQASSRDSYEPLKQSFSGMEKDCSRSPIHLPSGFEKIERFSEQMRFYQFQLLNSIENEGVCQGLERWDLINIWEDFANGENIDLKGKIKDLQESLSDTAKRYGEYIGLMTERMIKSLDKLQNLVQMVFEER